MVAARVIRILFILYCIEVGLFLTVFPWTSGWQQQLLLVLPVKLERLVASPFLRSAVSAFGLVHIALGCHDLERWLARARPPSK